ncbi:LysM peptidoglycan-binding domain-containing protein [Enterococcus sp. C76]|uniref:LysM peptidoglycan-binding domain-containing protein n=1 Tax=Enterococcus sp. C76 TaxID=3231334 RepID=UPI0034A0892D
MKLLRILAIGATIGGVALATVHEKVDAAEWTPRTVQQISTDIAKTNGKEYTIVYGDTLSVIAQATNQTVQSLAERNSIANVDLIYAGNKLLFNGDVMTVQNPQGETIAQTVVQDSDKIDPTKPVGQPVQDTTNSATQNTTTPSTDNTATGNTQTGGQTTDNTGSTTPSTSDSGEIAPVKPAETVPSDNPSESTEGSTGDTTTDSSQPTTPEEPVQYKYTVWYYADSEPQYTIEKGQHVFDTEAEATAWIDNYADNCPDTGSWGVMSWEVKQ